MSDAFVKMSHSHAQLQEQLLTQNSGETSSSSSFQIELLDQILIKMGHFLFTVLGKRLQNSESLMMSSLQLHVSGDSLFTGRCHFLLFIWGAVNVA